MWIVRLALRRPYTFVVMAMLIVLLGAVTILRMPTDIFPDIDIPVICGRLAATRACRPRRWSSASSSNYERALTTTVNDIEHIESQSLDGVGVVKIFFQPDAKIEAATAQVTAISQTAAQAVAAGHDAAADHPVQRLQRADPPARARERHALGAGALRPRAELPPQRARHRAGGADPLPYGGKQRQVMVDLDPEKLYAYGLSPHDVSNAVNAQNLILPGGHRQDRADRNTPSGSTAAPIVLAELNDLPIKTVERHHDLHARRRPRARRLRAADQHGPRRRQARRAACRSSRPAAPRRSTSSAASARRLPGILATLPEGAQGHAALRPVGLRPRGRRRAWSRRRRSPPGSRR